MLCFQLLGVCHGLYWQYFYLRGSVWKRIFRQLYLATTQNIRHHCLSFALVSTTYIFIYTLYRIYCMHGLLLLETYCTNTWHSEAHNGVQINVILGNRDIPEPSPKPLHRPEKLVLAYRCYITINGLFLHYRQRPVFYQARCRTANVYICLKCQGGEVVIKREREMPNRKKIHKCQIFECLS